jgi:hypothetical protein
MERNFALRKEMFVWLCTLYVTANRLSLRSLALYSVVTQYQVAVLIIRIIKQVGKGVKSE